MTSSWQPEIGCLELGDALFEAQDEWIRGHFGDKAADTANYGWAVDKIDDYIATKIYGHGVLTTKLYWPPAHWFEKF